MHKARRVREERLRRLWSLLDDHPNIPQISAMLGVGTNCAWRMLQTLQERGIIHRERGLQAYQVVEPFSWVEED